MSKNFEDGINFGAGVDQFSLVTKMLPQGGAHTIVVNHIKHQQNYDVDTKTNIGAGEDTLMSYTMKAEDLRIIGSCMEFKAAGHVTNSAGTKTIKAKLDGTVATIVSAENALLSWIAEGEIVRESAANLHYHVRMFDCDGTTGALGTQWAEFHSTVAVPLGTDVTLSFTGEAANATTGAIDQDLLLITHCE